MEKFSHINEQGLANMVDIGEKPIQTRIAVAEGTIFLQENTIKLIQENSIKKGDVLKIAEFAGIQAAKQTSFLIPLCHQLLLSKVDVSTSITKEGIYVKATTKCEGKTGVEMEALTAVNVCLLTIYDMCKAVDKSMIISGIKLISKEKF